jgi:uncharacterized protein (TIGR02145 family)
VDCKYCGGKGVIYTAAEKEAMKKAEEKATAKRAAEEKENWEAKRPRLEKEAKLVITLKRNKGEGYDNWEAFYDIPPSVRGDGIREGDTYGFHFAYESNVSETDILVALLDNSETATPKWWNALSEYRNLGYFGGIGFTFKATKTASSAEANANRIVFQVPASHSADEPVLIFSSFELQGGRVEQEKQEKEQREQERLMEQAAQAARASIGTFTDSRDKKVYKRVKIGTKTWMAENLNYDVPKVKTDVCYDKNKDNCAKYGRLYDWNTALKACPAGFHLPTAAEWAQLTDYIGERAGKKLKSTSGWKGNGNGTDDYGFSALPGGYGYWDGSFHDAGSRGYWWSSTENGDKNAWYRDMSYGSDEYVLGKRRDKSGLLSVRCVQD